MGLVNKILDAISTGRASQYQPVAGADPSGNSQILATETDGRLRVSGTVPGFAIPEYDAIVPGYTGNGTDPTTVTYKKGGVTVATLTLTYDGNGRLSQVVKS